MDKSDPQQLSDTKTQLTETEIQSSDAKAEKSSQENIENLEEILKGLEGQVSPRSLLISLAKELLPDLIRSSPKKEPDKSLEPASEKRTEEEILSEFSRDLLELIKTQNLIRIKLIDEDNGQQLTPEYLKKAVVPYIQAIADIQKVVDKVQNRPSHPIVVRSIVFNSPVSISLQGVSEATESIKDTVIPWRRKHTKQMSYLEEQEKRAQIENHRAEILEKRARAERERAEAKKTNLEILAEKAKAEGERLHLENEKLRIEIQEAKINLALSVLEKLSPDLPDVQRISYVLQLLEPLGVIIESPMMMIDDKDEKTPHE